MKRKIILFSLLFFFGAYGSQLHAQFTPEELAQRAQWEEFLKTAEIIDSQKIPEGVTKPIRIYLKKGEVETKGVWKNPQGIQQGFLEGWQYEIAAYRMANEVLFSSGSNTNIVCSISWNRKFLCRLQSQSATI